jgi:small subunit ribosomal protein S7
MSRRRIAVKKVVKSDTRYNSVLVSKFINNMMKDGKKAISEKILYSVFDRLSKKYSLDPFVAFNDALNNVKPHVQVTSVRVGGTNYQVPSPVSEARGYSLAIRWILDASTKRSGRSMIEKLSDEFFDASNNRGSSVKKREDTHKMAESNKAFSHFAQRSA